MGGKRGELPFQLPCAPHIQQDKNSVDVQSVLALGYLCMLYYNFTWEKKRKGNRQLTVLFGMSYQHKTPAHNRIREIPDVNRLKSCNT